MPIAVLLYSNDQYRPELVIEIVGADQSAADGFLLRLRQLIDEHNSFRGKVISFSFGMHGEFGLTFMQLPAVRRAAVQVSSMPSRSTPSASAPTPISCEGPVST